VALGFWEMLSVLDVRGTVIGLMRVLNKKSVSMNQNDFEERKCGVSARTISELFC